MITGASTFAAFPEFSKLTLADKQAYEALTKDFPPMYDTSFGGLMTWWNPFDNVAVSTLNNNLVLTYWLPGDEQNSGLSLLGTNKIDESICDIFDYQRQQGEAARLVNVPEVTISKVRYSDMFNFKEQRDNHEYVVPLSNFYPLKGMTGHWKRKVEKQIREVGEEGVVVRNLDLQSKKDKEQLLTAAEEWRSKNSLNDYGKLEGEVIEANIVQAEELDVENIGLFVDGQLRGFCLFQRPQDKRYVIVKHVKATHPAMFGFELIAYTFARWFTEQGFMYVNLGADAGIRHLRMFMLTLGPQNFFRKYIVEPA